VTGERFSVERVGEKGLCRQRFVARKASPVLLFHLVLGSAEFNLFLATIGAEEHELAGLRLDACLIEHCA
jgi:hypothetical protein